MEGGIMKGKVKELFEKWYYDENTEYWIWFDKDSIQFLEETEPSMQWGVLQDFYDSQDIEIVIDVDWDWNKYGTGTGKKTYSYMIFHDEIDEEGAFNSQDFKTRPEAREAALIKAEQILENKLK
jgi:hypothetical protein